MEVHPGATQEVYDDGTCDIFYNDGDFEKRVAPENIKPSAKRPRTT